LGSLAALKAYLFSKARILGFHLLERFLHGRELFLGSTLKELYAAVAILRMQRAHRAKPMPGAS
jgi:hypothetical protein